MLTKLEKWPILGNRGNWAQNSSCSYNATNDWDVLHYCHDNCPMSLICGRHYPPSPAQIGMNQNQCTPKVEGNIWQIHIGRMNSWPILTLVMYHKNCKWENQQECQVKRLHEILLCHLPRIVNSFYRCDGSSNRAWGPIPNTWTLWNKAWRPWLATAFQPGVIQRRKDVHGDGVV